MDLFEEYVKGYDFNNDKIVRKYKHTLRVKALCEVIAEDLNLNNEQKKIASLCGLYHDIARFEQATRYNSFDDDKTIDHGDLGYEIFLNEFADKLQLNQKDRMIIAKSILYHNKYDVEAVSEEELLFIKIVRDADKIDILYQYANVPGMLRDGKSAISIKCHEEFMKHHPLKWGDIINKRDGILLSLAFVWDLNFPCSFKIIKENKYYEKMEKVLNNEVFSQYFAIIKSYLKEK
ncbi:MAG: HD domain-containing protein [Firmicutes bacterium]|nr:HD domain-containing protein [Bacillota bacterium]